MHPALDYKSRLPVKILGDETPSNAFNSQVDCHQIIPGLNSALIFTGTATSEGVFAPLDGSLCLRGAILIVLQCFLAQYFEPSIVYIFRFPMDIQLDQS